MTFKLGPVLERDSEYVTDLQFSQIRLMKNADFPWVILVPRLIGAVEITDLTNDEYRMLNAEVRLTAKLMQMLFEPTKLNIATLGNVVRQMHYHVIARYENDKCFPRPVWGQEFTPYDDEQLKLRVDNIRQMLGHK